MARTRTFPKSRPDVVRTGWANPTPPGIRTLSAISLSLPGVSCAVTGIGTVDRSKPENDQLVSNLAAATQDLASPAERQRIEHEMAERYGATTNYFQLKASGLIQPTRGQGRQGEMAAIRLPFAGIPQLQEDGPLGSY